VRFPHEHNPKSFIMKIVTTSILIFSLMATTMLPMHTVAAKPLHDAFVVGNGRGITYLPGNIDGQQGGAGWVASQGWVLNGRSINIHVNPGNYVSFYSFRTSSTTEIRQIRREYENPGIPLDKMRLRTTVELVNLSGFNTILDTTAPPTHSGASDASARDYFAFFPRAMELSPGGVSTSSHWYIEASAGYWHVLPGGGNRNYSDPIPLAPLVEGETYQIEIAFSGRNTWSAKITAKSTNQTYESGWLSYISDNIDSQLSNAISYRMVREANNPSPAEIRVHDIAIVQN
jgi:hypothetical protein